MNVETIAFGTGIALVLYAIVNKHISIKGFDLPSLDPKVRVLVSVIGLIFIILGIVLRYDSIDHNKETEFNNPIYRDVRLDICLAQGGIGCGIESANKWCRHEQDYKFSTDFSVEQVGLKGIPTKLIGDDTMCREKFCTAFTSITCSK